MRAGLPASATLTRRVYGWKRRWRRGCKMRGATSRGCRRRPAREKAEPQALWAADRQWGRRQRTGHRTTRLLAYEAFDRGQAAGAAGDGEAACRWLDRACRLAPEDKTLTLALATACLSRDSTRSAPNCSRGWRPPPMCAEAWLGLATARRRLGDAAGAAQRHWRRRCWRATCRTSAWRRLPMRSRTSRGGTRMVRVIRRWRGDGSGQPFAACGYGLARALTSLWRAGCQEAGRNREA